jgi:hypothetical protein
VKRTLPLATALVALVTGACGSGSGAASRTGQGVSTSPPASATGPPSELVGRWEQARDCHDLVSALDQLGLGLTAPGVVGDFFPNETAQQLAKKPDLCAGAKPSPHSHFFTASGEFGSLDENLNQVDNGHYTIVNGHTLKIGDATFRYSIAGGDTLSLDPMITSAERKKALANPLEFSTATWMVAVSYPGTTWKRVPCEGWC